MTHQNLDLLQLQLVNLMIFENFHRKISLQLTFFVKLLLQTFALRLMLKKFNWKPKCVNWIKNTAMILIWQWMKLIKRKITQAIMIMDQLKITEALKVNTHHLHQDQAQVLVQWIQDQLIHTAPKFKLLQINISHTANVMAIHLLIASKHLSRNSVTWSQPILSAKPEQLLR